MTKGLRGGPEPSNGVDHLKEGRKERRMENGGRGPDVLMSASLRTRPLRMTISLASLHLSDKNHFYKIISTISEYYVFVDRNLNNSRRIVFAKAS